MNVNKLIFEFCSKFKMINFECELAHFKLCELNFEPVLVKYKLAQHCCHLHITQPANNYNILLFKQTLHELLTLCLLTYLFTHVSYNKHSGHSVHAEWAEVITELSDADVL